MNENQQQASTGWVQVNNTVVPYVTRKLPEVLPMQLIPLPVVQYGAGLLLRGYVPTLKANQVELRSLNTACKNAGLEFTFDNPLQLISLHGLMKQCSNLLVTSLPDDRPFEKCQFIMEAVDSSKKSKSIRSCTLNCEDGIDIGRTYTSKPIMENSVTTINICPLDLSNKRKEDDDVEIIAVDVPHRRHIAPEESSKSNASYLLQTSPAHGVYVRPIRIYGRTIPCIIKSGEQYVLVETIRKAYFEKCSLRAFMFIVQRCVGQFIFDLTPADVTTIKNFARNATSLDKCPRIILARDAEQMIPIVRNFLARVEQQTSRREAGSSGEKRSVDIPNPVKSAYDSKRLRLDESLENIKKRINKHNGNFAYSENALNAGCPRSGFPLVTSTCTKAEQDNHVPDKNTLEGLLSPLDKDEMQEKAAAIKDALDSRIFACESGTRAMIT